MRCIEALKAIWPQGREHNVALGRYVIMPDHIHLFVRGGHEFRLALWVRGLKRAISSVVAVAVFGDRRATREWPAWRPAAEDGRQLQRSASAASIWQRGFFDHLLRNSDSYSEKWNYVEQNPVRAGLVLQADDWPYAGEIAYIDRV